ncbi:MAG: MerR family transcriptional regulator [Planctomycetota bacterium]
MQTKASERFCVPAKLYRIGEIVRHTPFTRQTIHNYTTMGLIRESDWTEGGHRLYDESVFERLWQIQQLRKNKTLSEIQKLFKRKEETQLAVS